MRLLIENGADINAIGTYGDTALSSAAQKGNKIISYTYRGSEMRGTLNAVCSDKRAH